MQALYKRLIIWGAVAAILALALVAAFRPRPVQVESIVLQPGPMQVTVDEEGETRVHDVFAVSAPVAGRLHRIEDRSRAPRQQVLGQRPAKRLGIVRLAADLAAHDVTAVRPADQSAQPQLAALQHRVAGHRRLAATRQGGIEAALGGKVKVPTPAGTVGLTIPEGTTRSRTLRLKGRGIPGDPPGDLYAELKITLPPADSDAARDLYRKMERDLSYDPRSERRVGS